MEEMLIRFAVGGFVVSLFALLSDTLKPKSFAGLFGAAPSVGLATLSLTVVASGRAYGQTEARSMILGAVAFFFYASVVSWLLMRKNLPALMTTSVCLAIWLAAALGLRFLVLG